MSKMDEEIINAIETIENFTINTTDVKEYLEREREWILHVITILDMLYSKVIKPAQEQIKSDLEKSKEDIFDLPIILTSDKSEVLKRLLGAAAEYMEISRKTLQKLIENRERVLEGENEGVS